jgi:glycosyltransferase involved in cell wall biosynthesis
MDTFPGLAVVIISHNEANNIARAIESVLRAVESYPQAEIVLVDSASTDQTVEVAKQYPIDIVRLEPSWFLSAAAGRYIGMHHSRGGLIMHMDGDMELVDGWLNLAIPFLMERPELAGVAGYRRDVYVRDGQVVGEKDLYCDPNGHVIEVKQFGGAALYRRSALQQVGGFNPYIISDEEPELCMRLRYAGYKLMCIPHLMCRHYTPPMRSWLYFVRRSRARLWLGLGQVPRYHLRTGMFWMAVAERRTSVIYLAGLLVSVFVVLVALFGGNLWFLGAWVIVALVCLIVYAIVKSSVRETVKSIVHQSFVAYGVVHGFLIKPRSPEEYPTDAEIVQMHHRLGCAMEK